MEEMFRCMALHLEELNEEVERQQRAHCTAWEAMDEERRRLVELAKRVLEERILILFDLHLKERVGMEMS